MGLANESLHVPEFRKIMAEESFDLVITGWFVNTFIIGVGGHFKCPVVMLDVVRENGEINKLMGNPNSVSFVPSLLVPATKPMNFKMRLINMLASVAESVLTLYINSEMNRFYESNFPQPQYPSYEEMRKNISLALVNYHFSQGIPRPLVPAIIEIGGIQAKQKSSALPPDLEEWISSAKDGAIFFSLGSNIQSIDLPLHKRQAILQTFKTLKQHIVWKFEDDTIKDLPKNVKIWKWLPQDDILAHPNIRLFITHGGGGSIVEAKFYGVPVVGIPIFADQPTNIANVEAEGWGLGVQYSNLTFDNLSAAVYKVLNEPSYTNVVKTASTIYRDRPMTSLDSAVFWVEYVIRHHGAKHMQANSVHLNFWQFHSIDVIAFLSLILLTVLYVNLLIMKCALKFVGRKLFGKKPKRD